MKNNYTKIGATLFFITVLLISFNTYAQVQDITTVAGNGTAGYTGDGGAATAAEINSNLGFGGGNELGVAIDDSGNIYIADAGNNRIRKVNSSGVISTVAGGAAGTGGNIGDGGPATAARLRTPEGVAKDDSGNIYIADAGNNRIRKVTKSTGIINTVAGGAGFGGGYGGDGGAATAAQLNHPTEVALDASGNIYIADENNNRIREVTVSSGIINTVAGNGTNGYNGDGGPATAAVLNDPTGVAVDDSGNIYIADQGNYKIRKINTSDTINSVAGTGTNGYSGDRAAATAAELDVPYGVAVDDSGNIYIADEDNDRVRKVNTLGIINTVAGNGTAGYSGDGGPATSAELHSPTGVAVDDSGNIYIADAINNRIRAVYTAYPPVANFSASDSMGCINTTIQFTDESFSSIANKPTSWNWSFPGGTPATSTVENPIVVYNTLGTYSVSLVVSNSAGKDSITKTNYITINPLPTVTATPTADTSCGGASVALTGMGALTYAWAPAAGLSASTGSTVTAQATITTIYTVTGTDVNGCRNTATVHLTILPAPKITATPSTNPVCNGYAVTLTAKAGVGTTNVIYNWEPNSTLSSTTGASVTANPSTATTYTVVGIDTLNQCTDTASVPISIYGGAGFGYVVTGYTVNVSMDSINTCATDGYQWNFGGINYVTEFTTPSFTFPAADSGSTYICLKCDDDSTCPECINIKIPGNYSGNTNTGINVVTENNNSIYVFPNPNNGQFSLTVDMISGNPKLEIYNTVGQLVYHSATINNKELINLSNQSAGMYFIYLKSDESVEIGKVLITK